MMAEAIIYKDHGAATGSPHVHGYFDVATNAVCYIVKDPTSSACVVIDSILDFEMASGTITQQFADHIISEIDRMGLTLEWVLETHVHADHLSAAPYIARKKGGKLGIGARIEDLAEHLLHLIN
ncbi:MAG: MBL fold metallo-hydrolase, partial [Pseudomonadota bacterium]